jgi:hypothetical protein
MSVAENSSEQPDGQPDLTDKEAGNYSNPTGYGHRAYVDSFATLGSPVKLRASGGWLLKRAIPASTYCDGMSCYPIFSCADWSALADDLRGLSQSVVSVTLVTDPFGNYDPASLKECFGDLVIAFKNHFVTDLTCAPVSFISSHHRRNAQNALKKLEIEQCIQPLSVLDDWIGLYGTLIQRHQVKGIAVFSRASFEQQFKVPGLVALRAVSGQDTVGMLLWYVQGEVAYYHLGAYSNEGYKMGASFALFSRAIEIFANSGIRWLDLGASAGLDGTAVDGLSRFKKGWSTGTRTAYLCGTIFDRVRYEELKAARGITYTHYFPAYRQGEFA